MDIGKLEVIDKPLRLGIGILSWKGYASLTRMLSSFEEQKFSSLFQERHIFFPEIEDEGRQIAKEFGFTCSGAPDNLGVYGGFDALARAMKSEVCLFLENDLPLIEPFEEAHRQLTHSLRMLEVGDLDLVHIRHRSNPGEPFSALSKYDRFFPEPSAGGWNRASASIRRLFRPDKAQRLIGTAPYREPEPHKKFKEIQDDAETGFLVMSSFNRPWTNQPFIINREFFIETILARVKQVNSRRHVNGFKNIEVEVNGKWWRNRGYKVGIAPGLFTHIRLDDRGY